MSLAVDMRGITMRFGKVVANDNVDFSVEKGEILALVGENGAGKSTLMNILYGLYIPTEGSIRINGQEKVLHSAIDAISAGVGMVHQHFMLIPRLTVTDNIILGKEPHRGVRYCRSTARKEVMELCARYDMKLDVDERVADISLGMQQRVEIVKALYRKADILILDEPTAVLTPQEIDELGRMLKKLKAMGKTIIIITHKLQEVIDFSDRVTVLRQGKRIGTVNTWETTAQEITEMMVGRSVCLGGSKEAVMFQENVLELKGASYHNGQKERLKEIEFSIRKGEILGIAGIDNSGQKELTEVITGVLKPDKGQVLLEGEDITGQAVSAVKKRGVGFIVQDRHRHGLALNQNIRDNMILGYQRDKVYNTKGIFFNQKAVTQDVEEKIRDFDIRPTDMQLLAQGLSGGNQQKIIVAREVSHAGNLIIADQPTRGVDIGAIELIHRTLVEARNSGKAVLLVSLELDEVMMLSDRIAVMHDGKIMKILQGNQATREEIGLLMAGGGRTEDE